VNFLNAEVAGFTGIGAMFASGSAECDVCFGFLARRIITWFTVVNQRCPYVAYRNAAYYVCSLSLNEECLGIATLPLCSDSGNPSITKYDSLKLQ